MKIKKYFKDKKEVKTSKKIEKKAWLKSPRGGFLRLNASMVAFTMRRNYLSNFGVWMTSLGSIKEIPRASASSTEYEKVNKS